MYKMCRDRGWRDQEDGCCWNSRSFRYLTEVDEDEEICEEYTNRMKKPRTRNGNENS